MRHLSVFLISALLMVSVASNAQSATSRISPEALFQAVTGKLDIVMLQCPAKIWPTLNWKNFNVMFVQDEKPSLLWRASTGKVETIAESEVPAGARNGTFRMFSWQGQDALAVYVRAGEYHYSVAALTELIVHEGFHLVGQRGWKSSNGPRGTTYPVLAEPRIFRRMIMNRLQAYVNSRGHDKSQLSKAAYWFQKWKSNYPDEARGTTDGYEGTARYVELMGSYIAELGCDFTDNELRAKAMPRLPKAVGSYLTSENLRLDPEGYGLGGMASFVLRLFENEQTWYGKASEAVSPLEVLLGSIPTTEDVAPVMVRSPYEKKANEKNKEFDNWFAADVALLKNPKALRISFPQAALRSSFSPKGFFLPAEFPGIQFVPMAADLVLETADSVVTAKEGQLLMAVQENPCQGGGFVAVAPPEHGEFSFTLSLPTLQGTVKGTAMKDIQGNSWFCAK